MKNISLERVLGTIRAIRVSSREPIEQPEPPVRGITAMVSTYILLTIILVVQFFPLVWALLTSLQTQQETISNPITVLPQHPSLNSYFAALQSDIGHYYNNSTIAATVSTVITMVLATLAAYAFARLRFRFKTTLLLFVLSFSLFPALAQVIPVYQILQELHLIGTISGLILPYSIMGLPLAVLVLIAIFQDIPTELEEAAAVDGLSRWGTFLRVIIPSTLPGLFTATVIVFVGNWNEYLFALNYTTPDTNTLPVGLVNISQTQTATHFEVLAAAAIISVVPLIVRILSMQRSFVSGLTAGIFTR